ncbi:MAG: hypothetical protein Q9169_008076 [Polycauliona sp. 2 TL-2023]
MDPSPRANPRFLRPRDKDTEDTISILNLDRGRERGSKNSSSSPGLLGKLPLEIRQEIYGYVLGREENKILILSSKIRAFATGVFAPQFVEVSRYGFWRNRTAILRVRRQVYVEAVELLYTGNTFILEHPRVLVAFSQAVLPKRFNAIRNIRVRFQEAEWPVIEYPLDWKQPCSESGLLQRERWFRCWETIIGMQYLRSLHIEIRYTLSRHLENKRACQDLLLPLLGLRGIKDLRFRLEFGAMDRSERYYDKRDWESGKETRKLVGRIRGAAKLPRGAELGMLDMDGEDGVERELYPPCNPEWRRPPSRNVKAVVDVVCMNIRYD